MRSRGRRTVGVVLLVLLVSLAGCAEAQLYPITKGAHSYRMDDPRLQALRFVIWGDHPVVVSRLTSLIHEKGQTVVERAQLETVFHEQKIRLLHTLDDDAAVLRVGHLLGADRVIFADVTLRPIPWSRCGLCPRETLYYTSVSLRSVHVETGQITWAGTASVSQPIGDPESGLATLTAWAVARALCPTEQGAEWVEPGPWRTGGCRTTTQ